MINDLYWRVINLESRVDRKSECVSQFQQLGVPYTEQNFFAAKLVSHDGALGCAMSHARVLSDFLYFSDASAAMILEDDFDIVDKGGFVGDILDILSVRAEWDVFLLAHNQALPVRRTSRDKFFQVFNAQTTAAYIVNREFAPKLMFSFLRSSEYLRRFKGVFGESPKILRHLVAVDMLWKELALSDRFVASFPAKIVQRASFSNIEGANVDYRV